MSAKKLLDFINEITIADEKNIEVEMVAAAGVIVKRGENNETMVLLIQRAADDHWPLHFEFPRGKCDKPIGENKIHCLKREVKEETGLDIIPMGLIDNFEYLADKGTRHTVCYNYLCKMKDANQTVKLSNEHDGHKWITQMGEAELFVMPDQKKTLEKVLSRENPITSYPDNTFTKNNSIEEYLQWLSQKKI